MSGRALRWMLSWTVGGRSSSHSNGSSRQLTIVRHHRVYGRDERPLYRLGVSDEVFAAQLEMLAGLGLTPITVAEGLRFLDEGPAGHRVAMSFDDGYADNVSRALPLLSKYGARATFYLTAGWMEDRRAPWWDELAHFLEATRFSQAALDVGGSRLVLKLATAGGRRRAFQTMLRDLSAPPSERSLRLGLWRDALGVTSEAPCELATWSEARALVESGMEVGAHTMNHPLLSHLPGEEQAAEIRGSIDLIEKHLGVRPLGLAYPGGDHDATTVEVARATGLAYAVTTRAGDNHPGADRFRLKRRGLSDGACLGPGGRFSQRLARAELHGAFDRLRGIEVSR